MRHRSHSRPASALTCALTLAAAGAAHAQPANNNCANAVVIGNGTFSGTTVGATNDGSASCGSSASNADVWYRYVAPATGTITVTTCNPGTGYDTVLSVHSAACPGTSATQIACNDDASCAFASLRSTLTFSAVAGTEYLIRVSGFSSAVGAFELSVGPGGGGQPPVNDACASATAIGNGTFNGTTTNAAADGTTSCVGSASPDVYYRYTAPATGTVVASTCTAASFDTTISVHSACPATTANEIACNNDFCGTRSQVSFQAVQGQQYIIRVAGVSGSGTFTLTLGDPPPPGPSGPDVTHHHINGIANFGAVGGIRGYALGSDTCNIGTQGLAWVSSGTPALGMNAYRLHNGRLVQIGLGFAKTACCVGNGPGCGTTCSSSGTGLRPGCMDVYGASYNGGQTRLAPRSVINAYTGVIGSFPATTGDAAFRRLQVAQTDLNTTAFAGARYFVEGAYIATDDAQAGNAMNNNSYMIVNVNQSSFDLTPASGTFTGHPAIWAWRDHGLGINTPDPSVSVFSVDVPQEGRFWVATKVTQLAGGRYLYDYAVYNLNSDRSGYSLSVPKGAGVSVSNAGFSDVAYHSGEPYSGADWAIDSSGSAVSWTCTQTFAQNANANALRWGTMYNFWFESESAPTTGQVTLGLFKPGTPDSVSFDAPVPSSTCTADYDGNGTVEVADIFTFLSAWFAGDPAAYEFGGTPGVPAIFAFLSAWFAGCN